MKGDKGNKSKNKYQHLYIRVAALVVKQTLLDYRNNTDREDCIKFFNSDSYIFDILEYGKLEKELLLDWCKCCKEEKVFKDLKTRMNRVKAQIKENKRLKKIEENSFSVRKKRILAQKKKSSFIAQNEPFIFES